MTGKKDKPARVIAFKVGSVQADASRQRKREAKARNLKQRFAAARCAQSKSRAAGRLQKLFKKPPRNT